MANLRLQYKMVPSGFQHCANKECPRAAECMRQKVYEMCPDQGNFITIINPRYANVHAAHCKFFHPIRIVRYAKGFTRLLADLPKRTSDAFHSHFHILFGHTQYYRARRGELLLDEESQRYIRQYLTQHGCEVAEPFDDYEEAYEFLSIKE